MVSKLFARLFGRMTLIEWLAVVIVCGVVAAIAIPVYIGVQDNAKAHAARVKESVKIVTVKTGWVRADKDEPIYIKCLDSDLMIRYGRSIAIRPDSPKCS